MAKFRKRPVVIEAIQWTGDNIAEAADFLGGDFGGTTAAENLIHIETLEGLMNAPAGHWLIRGVKGEHYSCDPDVFAMTYEPVAPETVS